MEPVDECSLLLVDDRPENLLALELTLADLGVRLVKAHSGSEALRHMLNEEFALVLLDAQMPEMDGFETARLIRMREKTRQTPIMFLTAMYTTEVYEMLGYESGAVDYMVKPFEPAILKCKVSVFVELHRKNIQLKRQGERLRRLEREQMEQSLNALQRQLEAEQYRAREELLQKETEARVLLEQTNRLQETSERLEEVTRRRSEIMSHMTHEVRTPIGGIIGLAEILLRSGLDSEQYKIVSLMRESGLSLLKLVSDLLDMSKLEAGKLTLSRDSFSVSQLVEQAVSLLLPTAQEKGLVLTTQMDPDLPPRLVGDSLRIRQVLLNLVGNAIKFTDAGEVNVYVALSSENQNNATLSFSVVDTGVGLSPNQFESVFEPFVQGSLTPVTKYGGTGLGLSISKSLVQMMGGEIHAEGVPGKGSKFWFTVVVEKSANNAESEGRGSSLAQAVEVPSVAKMVLVADDSRECQLVTVLQLKRLGVMAQAVSNGSEAVESATKNAYSLILMDCHMPVMDGLQATRKIRLAEKNAKRHTPIVAVTAGGPDSTRERCLAAGMDDYMNKPVSIEELRRVLQEWSIVGPDLVRKDDH